MYKYTLAVTSPEYWNTIHNVLTVDSNEDGIPDRKVTCSDSKEHSPTRGTYLLTHEENKLAHKFYEKVGFKHETTLSDHYYKDVNERVYSIFFNV